MKTSACENFGEGGYPRLLLRFLSETALEFSQTFASVFAMLWIEGTENMFYFLIGGCKILLHVIFMHKTKENKENVVACRLEVIPRLLCKIGKEIKFRTLVIEDIY